MPYDPNYRSPRADIPEGAEIARCPQCGKPVTEMNIEEGPTGVFCSAECREQHERVTKMEAELEQRRAPVRSLNLAPLWTGLFRGAIIVVVFFGAGFAADAMGRHIPVLSNVYHWILRIVGQ